LGSQDRATGLTDRSEIIVAPDSVSEAARIVTSSSRSVMCARAWKWTDVWPSATRTVVGTCRFGLDVSSPRRNPPRGAEFDNVTWH
jgi:hypothetical protein